MKSSEHITFIGPEADIAWHRLPLSRLRGESGLFARHRRAGRLNVRRAAPGRGVDGVRAASTTLLTGAAA